MSLGGEGEELRQMGRRREERKEGGREDNRVLATSLYKHFLY